MDSERKIDSRLLGVEYSTKEARDRKREEAFNDYWKKLGLSSRDVVDADILDVGAGPLAAFGDQLQKVAKEKRFNCQVISIDKKPFFDIGADEVDRDKNFRVGGVNFENLRLQRKLELEEEPRFNTIVAMNSVPLNFARSGERTDKRWSEAEVETLRQKVRATIDSTLEHLKVGGRAIFYPIFKAEIFRADSGEEADFSKWRTILEEELAVAKRHLEDKFNYFFQEVDRPDGIHIHERLIIERKR